ILYSHFCFVIAFFNLLSRSSPLFSFFPYTTLFRSTFFLPILMAIGMGTVFFISTKMLHANSSSSVIISVVLMAIVGIVSIGIFRSEEHTSELQSRFDLVCRLLLEKKKLT